MNRLRWLTASLIVALTGALAWLLFIALPAWYAEPAPAAPAPAESPSPILEPRIKVKLYFVAPNGLGLESSEQEIPVGHDPLEQARRILEAQLAPATPPRVSAIPPGAALRAVYLVGGSRAVVDLTSEVATQHPGGSLCERLTVATIVEALTSNLPAVSEVQILVSGKEVDTLAGHVDLHRRWTRHDAAIVTPAPDDADLGAALTPQPKR